MFVRCSQFIRLAFWRRLWKNVCILAFRKLNPTKLRQPLKILLDSLHSDSNGTVLELGTLNGIFDFQFGTPRMALFQISPDFIALTRDQNLNDYFFFLTQLKFVQSLIHLYIIIIRELFVGFTGYTE